jgi:hypothetical protein
MCVCIRGLFTVYVDDIRGDSRTKASDPARPARRRRRRRRTRKTGQRLIGFERREKDWAPE